MIIAVCVLLPGTFAWKKVLLSDKAAIYIYKLKVYFKDIVMGVQKRTFYSGILIYKMLTNIYYLNS